MRTHEPRHTTLTRYRQRLAISIQKTPSAPTLAARNLPVVLPHTRLQKTHALSRPTTRSSRRMHRNANDARARRFPIASIAARKDKPHSTRHTPEQTSTRVEHSRSVTDAHQTPSISQCNHPRSHCDTRIQKHTIARRRGATANRQSARTRESASNLRKEWQTHALATHKICSQRNHYPTGNHSLRSHRRNPTRHPKQSGGGCYNSIRRQSLSQQATRIARMHKVTD